MKVFEIMSDRVATIEPDAPAAAARALLQAKGIHHLAVVRDGELQGVLSSHDIPAEAVASRQRSALVSDLMQRHVVTIGRNVPVSKAATLMGGRAIGSVIVTDRRKVVGIITVSDLLELVARGAMRQPKRAARPILSTRVPHRKQHRAGGAW